MSHYQASIIERLREKLNEARERRLDELRTMQAKYERRLAKKESARLDAIQLAETRRVDANRAADAAAIVLSTTRAEITASALAEKVTTSADTLVKQVEQTKIAAALSVDATTETLGSRIKPLEDVRYASGLLIKIVWGVIGFSIPVITYLLTQRP